MKKEELRILIVEDDPTLGKALQEAIARAGFDTTLAKKPDEAIAAGRRQPFHAALIDCMLPKMHGVELAQHLREDGSENIMIAMMSGVFKDKSFIKEALQKTQA